MATQTDIKTVQIGREQIKVAILSQSAQGKLWNVVRADGIGSGNIFVVEARQEVK